MRLERGLKWVDDDVDCAAVLFEQVKDIATDVLPHVTDFSVCVQAGGNCGLFPLELAKSFQRVVTAEPDPANYEALEANTRAVANIAIHHCAWGQATRSIAMITEAGNCGASYVDWHGDGRTIAQSQIDDLKLTQCGLIYLDVEGFEEFALRGAQQTIINCRPTIVVEAKQLSRRYGRTDAQCADYLQKFGYRVVHKFDNDVVWRPLA